MAEPARRARPHGGWTLAGGPARRIGRIGPAVLLALLGGAAATATELADVIERVRPSIVGIGTVQATRRPPNRLLGTGFAVGDGTLVVTNAHVPPATLDSKRMEHLVAFTGRGRKAGVRRAEVVARDERHDLALLRIEGTPLPALRLGDAARVREGTAIAFTGFPIGAVLGLYPVTHTGIVSAITPIIIPAFDSRQLSAADIRFLRDPFDVFQLDATAYPGNSGSPVYDPRTGEVIGVVNQVFVKDKKEDVLKDPSAISYAIPATYLQPLLEQAAGAR